MKKIEVGLMVLALGLVANAGVLKFGAKHVAKPVAKASAKAAKASAHAGVKVAKGVKKVVF